MIRRYNGEFIAECNECGNEHYGGFVAAQGGGLLLFRVPSVR